MLALPLAPLDLLALSFTQRQPHQITLQTHTFTVYLVMELLTYNKTVSISRSKLKTFFMDHFLTNFNNTPGCFHCMCPCAHCCQTPATDD